MRTLKLGVIVASLLVISAVRGAPVHALPFPAPTVSLTLSSAAPGGHPDLQTRIEVSSGELFDQVQVFSPPGGSVAQDGELPEDLIVGRLDAEATTNALTRPTCDQHVAFTVPIRTAPANPDSPSYPQFLKTLAPGKHRLRLIADVSPSPQVPVVVNYLFDIDPVSNGVVLRVFIGDPDHPATQLKTCAPTKSKNTLFGVTPIHTPLLTASAVVADPRFPFTFEFRSRPDASGVRHTQKVSVVSEIRAVDEPPLPSPPPVQSAPHGDGPPAQTGLPISGADAAGGTIGILAPRTGSGPTANSQSTRRIAFGFALAGVLCVIAAAVAAHRNGRHICLR